MKKKKMIYTGLIILLVAFVLFTYNEFNGNPVSKFISKQVLESYLSEKYPEKELRITEGHYNFKFSEYSFTVREIGSGSAEGGPLEYEFNTRGFLKPIVHWDGIYYANLDEPLMDRLSKEAEQEILGVLAPNVENIVEVRATIEILKGKLAEDAVWSKKLTLEKPLYLYILLDSTNDSKEEVLEKAKTIQHILTKEGYDYSSVTINGNGFDATGEKGKDEYGYVIYSVSFEKDTDIKLQDVSEFDQ